MKRTTLLLLFALSSLWAGASHIVGGEFELIHIEDFSYRLNLILYFDALNGNPGAFDPEATIAIYRKKDDAKMLVFTLPFDASVRVDYFQPSCSKGEVVTDKYIYTEEILLSPELFNDPEGYYIVWQRCCRNYTISNIYSQDPNVGFSAGQTFYLKIPPVVDQDGNPFVNSSPQLFPPLNDYACPYRPYWVDFAGVDLDGDSLVYSISEPLNTQFQDPFPPGGEPLPGPYPTVQWRPGFGLDNIMNGLPDLEISNEGFLTLTPRSQGLFVFAVKVDEFRDGVKIGEVRRDFQMLVVDKCPQAEPPLITGSKIDSPLISYTDYMDVTFNQGINAEERCILVEVSDPDALEIIDNFTEEVYLKAIPIGFRDNVSEVLPEEITATLINGSTASFSICFPECPYVDEGPFQIGIVAFDDACALPLSDTLRISVTVQPPPNNTPYFQNAPINVRYNETVNGFQSWNIVGLDDDNDEMYLNFFPLGFSLSDFGMSLTPVSSVRGRIETRLDWNFDCIQTSFDGKQEFKILAIVDDYDYCLLPHPDTLMIDLAINLPPNTFPDIYSDELGARSNSYFRLERTLLERINFDVFAEDLDNDPIRIDGIGSDFDLGQYGAVFPEREGNGVPGLGNTFDWFLDCFRFDLAEKDSFRFYLFVEDFDYCNITSKDTLTIDLIMNELENEPPDISFTSDNSYLSVDGTQGEVTVGNPVILNVSAIDPNPNGVILELVRVEGGNANLDFSFESVSGFRNVSSQLIWNPSCEALQKGLPGAEYTFVFKATDDFCIEEEFSEVSFTLIVNDIEAQPIEFLPPNFFSPNGDTYNSFFAFEWTDENGQFFTAGLPIDNCAGSFIEIRIMNRWGRQVYTSNDRDFRWYGEGESSGVYYYYVQYSNREFKGTVTMLY